MTNHQQPHVPDNYSESDLEAIKYIVDLQSLAGLTDDDIAYQASISAANSYSHTMAEDQGKQRHYRAELEAQRDYARQQLDRLQPQSGREDTAQGTGMPWGHEMPGDLGGIELAMVLGGHSTQQTPPEMKTVSAEEMTYPGGSTPSIGYGYNLN